LYTVLVRSVPITTHSVRGQRIAPRRSILKRNLAAGRSCVRHRTESLSVLPRGRSGHPRSL